jgi:hypothetical protein
VQELALARGKGVTTVRQHPEVRLALVTYGGVSLAIYIIGVSE